MIFWFRSSVFEFKDLSLGWKVDKNFDQRVVDTDTAKQQHFLPNSDQAEFLINGPGGDRFDTTHSTVNNSGITKNKKTVFAPREAQFSDKKSKLFVIAFATLIFN